MSASHPPCKSELMLLCERFRDRCGRLSSGGEPTRIHLNECAVSLGVPRRRLYDITIVYEAVEVISSSAHRKTGHMLRKSSEAHQFRLAGCMFSCWLHYLLGWQSPLIDH